MSINLSQKEINSVINALLHIKNYHDVSDIGETIRKFEQHKQSCEQKHVDIKACAYTLLMDCASDDYAHRILDVIATDIVDDVDECADPVDWNEDDVRLAIGRALVNKLESNNTDTQASVDSSTNDTTKQKESDDYTNPIIGHVYEINGIKCTCVEVPDRKDCSGCIINQRISSWSMCDHIRCSHGERNDKKNVYFVEVDK